MSQNRPRWRSGVVLEWDGCRALVKADAGERRVVARGARRESRRRLLAVIRSDFERIHGEIPRLEVKAKVPLPEDPEVTLDYEDLLGFERDGVREVPVRAGGRTVRASVADLLNGVELTGARRTALPRGRTMDGETNAFKLFYSYSHKDEALRDELETHLKLLQREGVITTWHDRRIVGGEDWGEGDR